MGTRGEGTPAPSYRGSVDKGRLHRNPGDRARLNPKTGDISVRVAPSGRRSAGDHVGDGDEDRAEGADRQEEPALGGPQVVEVPVQRNGVVDPVEHREEAEQAPQLVPRVA